MARDSRCAIGCARVLFGGARVLRMWVLSAAPRQGAAHALRAVFRRWAHPSEMLSSGESRSFTVAADVVA